MDHHFSTVLQRPPHFDEDGSNRASSEDRAPRGGLRDILNPVSSALPPQAPSTSMPTPPRPPHSSAFSLRSPTQPEFHHPAAYSGSPPSATSLGREPSGPRSILNNPFMSAQAAGPSLPPPPLQTPSSTLSSSGAVATATGSAPALSNLQRPSRSPLHAPSIYYPTDLRDRDPARDKPASGASNFYDPTVDAAPKKETERTLSDASSWRTATPKVSKSKSPQAWGSPQSQSPNPPSSSPSSFSQTLAPPAPRHIPSKTPSPHPPILKLVSPRPAFLCRVAQKSAAHDGANLPSSFPHRNIIHLPGTNPLTCAFITAFRLAIPSTIPNPPQNTTTGATHPPRPPSSHPLGVPARIPTPRSLRDPPAR